MELKDSLLVVHASDEWINSKMDGEHSFILRNKIRSRVLKYIDSWKWVIYSPYINSETSEPDYIKWNYHIEIAKHSDIIMIPVALKLIFEAIMIKNFMFKNSFESIELIWVQCPWCVTWTQKALQSISKKDIEDFSRISGEDLLWLLLIEWYRVTSEINRAYTDYVFRS